nr:MAG: hypothetical protein DIU64_11465 [Caldicoprobacter oshimai]
MNRITFSTSNCNKETISVWLASIIQFAFDIGFFKPFETFTLKMKEVRYTVTQKLFTILVSIIMGCEYTKDINEVLGPESLAANMLSMERFPDQSQINRLLIRTDEGSVIQLRNIHNQLFTEHSHSIHSPEPVVVDIDQSGLLASGKTYEFANKGYFPNKTGKKGYQLSVAFAGEHSEIVDLYLDPGNTHCQYRFDDLLSSITSKYIEHLKSGKLILRLDSGYGSAENIEKLKSIKGLKFIVKGYSTKTAANIAKSVPLSAYTQVNDGAWVYELPQLKGGLRVILVQFLGKYGDLTYTLLYTNISKEKLSTVEAFHFYNGRQTIEAFFKIAKNTYGVKNLRTSKFYGIYTFLWMMAMAHNLITWFKVIKLDGTELKKAGIKTLVKKCSRIRGFVERTLEGIRVVIPPLSKLARLLIEALLKPDYVQLSFLI